LVEVKVYDMLGREIRTLVNEWKESGEYSARFYAEGLPSGVYWYRLNAFDARQRTLATETKRMIFVR
jgi:hypothetical protein